VASIPPFQAYLFDVDGTLLDSAPDICGALSTVLANTSKPDVPHDFLRTYIGRHLVELFQDLFPEAPPEQIDAWIQEYRTIYPQRGHASTRLYPGVAETLPLLGGLKTTATTKGTPTATVVLTQFGLIEHFHHVQGTDGFPSKPEPDVLHRAMAALGVQPEECLMIGDSVPDMIAGRAAGVKVCAVSYGYGHPDALRDCQPDYWLDSFAELVPPGAGAA
jgi:HAD superfamily hydrolase (TIGR01509 family)